MTGDQFWTIIGEVHEASGGDMETKCDLLKERLRSLSDADLADFISHFDTAHQRAYSWPLWGAAYLIEGGCSDDGFMDFRSTLISMGRSVFEAALSNPDSLAGVDFQEATFEGFQYVATEVAESRPGFVRPAMPGHPATPSGKEWEEDDLASLFPSLAEKYLNGPGEEPDSGDSKPWWKIW